MPLNALDSGQPPTPLYLDKKRYAWLFSVIGPGLSMVGTVAVSFYGVGTWILFFPLVFFGFSIGCHSVIKDQVKL